MTTLNNLIADVLDDLNRTDLTAQCSAAIVTTIRHYDKKRWWFTEASATFTTNSSTSVYALTSNFRAMDYIECQWPGDNWQELRVQSFPYIKRMLEGQTVTGYPQNYTIRDQSIWLAYQPNDAYLVRYYYLKAFDPLTASASNNWTSDCKDLIRAGAAKTVALRTLHDPELGQLFSTIEESEYIRLREENDRRTASGKIDAQY